MAEALVFVLLKQLASIAAGEVEQERKLVVGVDEEIRKLEDNLRIIQAVLEDAEKRQVTNAAVKLWLEKLKDASYEMDDVLDEWNTALIKARLHEEEEEEEEIAENTLVLMKKKKKVRSFIPSPSCCFRQTQKLRLRHDIAHKIKELTGTLDEIVKKKVAYGFELTKGTEVVERLTTTSFVDVSDISGRNNDRNDLVSYLLGKGSGEERNFHVISLVGMGGIGKTTLAQLVYNYHKVQAHFEKRMWVCVSESFDQCRVAKAIIESIENQSPNIIELQCLLNRICDLIKGKKFFLVLDDVWTKDHKKWEPFKNALKCGAQGSRILVTTRNEEIVKIMGSAFTINLEVLSNEDCWLIFSKIAFFERDLRQCKQLEDLGRQLANKCKGLPLAAKTLGGLMRFKKSREQWKNVLDSSLWQLEDVEEGIFIPLLLSYYELPSAIKQCFLYCAVFPKDHYFSRKKLVYKWMAQGFLHSKANIELEGVGEEYFENLAMRSFFQDFEKDINDGRIIGCKMHDIVHDLAQFMTRNKCFAIIADGDHGLGIDCKNARHLLLTLTKETQHVSVYNAKKLRTFFVQDPNIVVSNLLNLTCVRKLSLKWCSIKKLPDEVEYLMHLRYLNLSHSKLEELPETICNLCNLQTLDVSECHKFKELPQGLGKLINLRHLILKKINLRCPKGIGRLTSLRTLTQFSIDDWPNNEGCKLGELKKLNHLQGDLIIDGLGNVDVREAENAQLKKKIHLRHLHLSFDKLYNEGRGKNDILVLNVLEPHGDLEHLEINEYWGSRIYSNWITSLIKLKVIELIEIKLKCLPPLGKLQFLESLKIQEASCLKKVGVEFLGIESNKKEERSTSSLVLFPNLKSLKFLSSNEWEEWSGVRGSKEEREEKEEDDVIVMPCLQSLTIYHCLKLKSLPDFFQTIPLKELEIVSCPILDKHCQRGTGEEWSKISHIPQIKIDHAYVQIDGRDPSV